MKLKFVCQKFRLMDLRFPALGFMAQFKPCVSGEPGVPSQWVGDDRFDIERIKVDGKMVEKRTWKDVPIQPDMNAPENEAALAPAAIKLTGILTMNNLADGAFVVGQEYDLDLNPSVATAEAPA